MKFDKVVNVILEEINEKRKIKLLDPIDHKRGYMEKKGSDTGYEMEINPPSNPNTTQITEHWLTDSDVVRKIKEEWEKAILIPGKTLSMFLPTEEVAKYNIRPVWETIYIVNDMTGLEHYETDWEYWLEPRYENYVSKDTVDEFRALMDEL